jgi:hypothetical protein
MSARRNSKSRSRPRTFAPRLEALEDRQLLTATASVAGGVLTIAAPPGDTQPDNISITDNGSAGTVDVSLHGSDAGVVQSFTGITKIIVDTKGGADKVTYYLTGDITTVRDIQVSLGEDDDKFEASTQGHPSFLNGAQFNLSVDGGAGKDDIQVYLDADLGRSPSPPPSLPDPGRGPWTTMHIRDLTQGDLDVSGRHKVIRIPGKASLTPPEVYITCRGGSDDDHIVCNFDGDIARGAHLNLDARGGAGADQVWINYAGTVHGALGVLAEAEGQGYDHNPPHSPNVDTVGARLHLLQGSDGTVGGTSPGIAARVDGSSEGDDVLMFDVWNDGTASVSAELHGWGGWDTCVHSDNVQADTCKIYVILPQGGTF